MTTRTWSMRAILALAVLAAAPAALTAHTGDGSHLHVGLLHPWLRGWHLQLTLVLLAAAVAASLVAAVTRDRAWARATGFLAGAALLAAMA